MIDEFIPVSAPMMAGNEKKYVMDCLESNWISSRGKYIEKFETTFAEFCGVKHAVSCTNGTTALHLALLALGVSAGDEVIVPTLTFVATANAVKYCGANPVFIDSERRTWNMDPDLVEAKITPQTKGIIVVHLYGHSVNMDRILEIAQRHNLFVLEDAAEAHGAKYKGQIVGSMGDVGTFSFFGNKVLSTGEGGMVVTNNERLAGTVRLLKDQGMDQNRRYWYPVIGYNYRMTNIAAAIGLAQVEMAEWHVGRRREVASWYREQLEHLPGLIMQVEEEWARHVYQFFTVTLAKDLSLTREQVIEHLQRRGIEGRPVVFPMHSLPPYSDPIFAGQFPVAEEIALRGINLPTSAMLTHDDVRRICETLVELISAENQLNVSLPTSGLRALEAAAQNS